LIAIGVLSVLFFLYTSILTTMVSYSAYNHSATPNQLAKPARNLPLHYTIFVSTFGVVVHWMASQAFFVASVLVLDYPPDRNDGYGGLYVDAGYSPIAIIFTLIVGGAAFLGMGLRRYRVD